MAGCREADEEGFPVAGYIEQDYRQYLECGILAHGFARARCAGCGYNFLIAYSCKGRGICPSCNTRRMVETAAHLVDQVFPQVPVRQWVLSFPKRLRYFLAREPIPGTHNRMHRDCHKRHAFCAIEAKYTPLTAARAAGVRFIGIGYIFLR